MRTPAGGELFIRAALRFPAIAPKIASPFLCIVHSQLLYFPLRPLRDASAYSHCPLATSPWLGRRSPFRGPRRVETENSVRADNVRTAVASPGFRAEKENIVLQVSQVGVTDRVRRVVLAKARPKELQCVRSCRPKKEEEESKGERHGIWYLEPVLMFFIRFLWPSVWIR